MNIGSRLILSFLLVTLVPTILLAYLTTDIISTSRKEDAQTTINSNLKAAWMQYYARAYQIQYGMLQASTESYFKKALIDRDKAFLRGQLKAWKSFREYVDLWAVVDRDARTIASHNTAVSGVNLSFNGLVDRAIESNKPVISTEVVPYDVLKTEGLADKAFIAALHADTPDASRKSSKDVQEGLMVIVVTPVSDGHGRAIGAIVTGDLLNNDSFVSDTMAEFIPGTLVSIVKDNVQIATNDTDETGKRAVGRLIPEDIVSEIRRTLGYRGEALIAGRHYLTAFDPIINFEAGVVGSLFVGVPKERFVELQNQNIKAIMTIAFIGFILASAAAAFITYRLTRPIKALTRKAQLISAGNLDVMAGTPKEGNDELAELSRKFDVMVQSLRENEERISISQEKLGRQKNLIESIINSLPYCLYVIERNLGIVVWNRHSSTECPICKCAPGKDCYNLNFIAHLYGSDLVKGLEPIISGVFETGVPRTMEQRLTAKDGRTMALRTTVFPISLGGTSATEYVVWMAEDITKYKEIEAGVIASEKLAAIGQLAAGIAHEVNNPIGGILNCFYNFRKKKLTDERKAEYLDFMEDGIKRVQNIVRQLLDFSQQHTPELRLTDIKGLIEGITPLFIHSLRGKDVRLATNLGEGFPPILVDKHQIEQVLVNLILNAIQAIGDDGTIGISTRFDGKWYCIMVADTGCGIPQENVRKIFDPFFTTKGVGKGTGLGLSVSRGIIERHKGRIEVDSRVSEGTTFRIYLPMAALA
ncbi:MAG: ATP-binding protein [Deltaproteobacteria bacterium]